jgi:hypothetical protein
MSMGVCANTCPWGTGKELIRPIAAETQGQLSRQEILEDLDCLEILLMNVYVATDFFPEHDFKGKLQRLKLKTRSQSADELLPEIFDLHKGLVDLHVSYSTNSQEYRFTSMSADYGLPMLFKKVGKVFERVDDESSSNLVGCDELEAVPLEFKKNHFVFKLKKGIDPKASIHCHLENGKEVIVPQAYSLPDVEINNNHFESDKIYHLENNIIYFKPGSLININPDQQAIIDYVKSHDHPMIIDLTHNPGGGDKFPDGLAQAIFTSQEIIPAYKRFQLSSPLQTIGLANTYSNIGLDQADHFIRFVTDYYSNSPVAELIPRHPSVWEKFSIQGQRSESYKSRIILLTSSECQSACESFIELIGTHPSVKTIGGNTAGTIHFANAATFSLPRTGIQVYLPTIYSMAGHDAEEGVGYPPEVRLKVIDLNKASRLFDL